MHISRSNWNLEVLAFKERGKLEHPEKIKPLRAREGTNNKLNPHIALMPGIDTQATLVGGECSHHCDTLANDQWPKWISTRVGGGGGEEGHSSSLKGSPSGLFPLLIITRGLIIDWYISKFQKKGEHGIHLN